MTLNKSIVALDVGEKRIGVALADGRVKIAIAYDTIEVDGNELKNIVEVIESQSAGTIVVGYPRNQSGEPTKQTEFVEQFADKIRQIYPNLVFQDESLSSVRAEEILNSQKKPYKKADVDALAASLILQDYLES